MGWTGYNLRLMSSLRAKLLQESLILFTCAVTQRLEAHIPTYGVGTLSRLIFKEDKILLTVDLSYDGLWAQGEMILADTDKDSKVSEEEANAYIQRQWTGKVSPRPAMRGASTRLSNSVAADARRL